MNLPPDIPPEAVSFLTEMGYLDEDRLRLGDMPPQITLQSLTGEAKVTLGLSSPQSMVLIFGSYT